MKLKYKQLKEMYLYNGYNKKIVKLVLLIIFCFIFEIITIPYLTKQILDIEIPNKNVIGVIIFGVIFVFTTIFSCYIVLKFCILRLNLRILIENDLRKDVFEKLQKIQTSFYDKNTIGTVLQFLSNDADDASTLFPRILVEMLIMGLLRILVISLLLMFINLEIGLGIIIIYFIGYLYSLLQNKKTLELLKLMRYITIENFNYMSEGIQGFTTIKTLSIEEDRIKKLEKSIDKYTKISKDVNKVVSRYNAIFEFITSFTTVWIIFKGTISMQDGLITYGLLMVIIEWADSIKSNSQWLLKHLTSFNKSYIAFAKILEFIKIDEIEELEKGNKLEKIRRVEFSNVSFEYNKKDKVIDKFNLQVNEEEHVAIVGKTGSGKSTIVNMLCRFYDPSKGKILINDKDIKKYNIKDLRSKIGYVMQDIVILKHSITDNIRYANPNITMNEIQEIFKKLNLHNKIMSLKDKYETNIYDNPDILSNGEKQLINFARIMAIDPEIVILDEVTSSLSYKSEILLKNAMEQITKNKISFIIAHRLSTVKKCDKILVMNNGKIVEEGKHEELLNQKGEYYKLVHKIEI